MAKPAPRCGFLVAFPIIWIVGETKFSTLETIKPLMINVNLRNNDFTAVPDPSILFEAESANATFLETAATYMGILISLLLFSGWLFLRSLRLLRHDGKPLTNLFGPAR